MNVFFFLTAWLDVEFDRKAGVVDVSVIEVRSGADVDAAVFNLRTREETICW